MPAVTGIPQDGSFLLSTIAVVNFGFAESAAVAADSKAGDFISIFGLLLHAKATPVKIKKADFKKPLKSRGRVGKCVFMYFEFRQQI